MPCWVCYVIHVRMSTFGFRKIHFNPCIWFWINSDCESNLFLIHLVVMILLLFISNIWFECSCYLESFCYPWWKTKLFGGPMTAYMYPLEVTINPPSPSSLIWSYYNKTTGIKTRGSKSFLWTSWKLHCICEHLW
jgi:hypothetical protein